MTTIEEYFEYQTKYEAQYGSKTIVLMEVGTFYEMYGIDNDTEKIGRVSEVAELLNIQLTRKNKNIRENNHKNPLLAGFQSANLNRFLQILIRANYTSILVEQITSPPNPKRAVTQVISPATYIDDLRSQESCYLASIYIEGNNNPFVGMSAIDLSTGQTTVYEVSPKSLDDNLYSLDEIYRFIRVFNPKELIINSKDLLKINEDATSSILRHLELKGRLYHFKPDTVQKDYYKTSYQNQFFQKIYPDTGFLTPLEYLDLEKLPVAALSFLLLLQFSYQHNENILKKVNRPNIWQNKDHLTLDYNTVEQLNVISYQTCESISGKFDSIFSVVNNTSTPMGRRLLQERLLSPSQSVEILNQRYQQISEMKDNYIIFENILKSINDIERLHRKMALQRLQPHEFVTLHLCYNQIQSLITTLINLNSCESLIKLLPSPEDRELLNKYQQEYQYKFDLNVMETCSLQDLKTSFFKKDAYVDIQKIYDSLISIHNNLDNLANKLAEIIKINSTIKSDSGAQLSSLVKVEYTDKEGHYLLITDRRCNILKKHSPEQLIAGLKFKTQSTNKKITGSEIDKYSNKIISLREKLKNIVTERYLELLQTYTNNYQSLFQILTQFVAEIDLIKSNAKTATIYNYCRPVIINLELNRHGNESVSYINSTGLRHPLVERLVLGEIYTCNDIEIGTEKQRGILLYGLNAVGKTTFVRAVGCNLILAQAGMYTAATTFEFFPYERIITRITGNDNIFKGQSSFAVEMSELRTILRRSNFRTLVLGDEICRGTEQSSGLAIVTATIITLHNKTHSSFIFATHLHSLPTLSRIQSLQYLNHYHFQVTCDPKTNKIIYNRILKPGNGSSVYGIEVARAMDLGQEFIELSLEIRREITGQSNELLPSTKPSRYNKNIYLDICKICQKNKAEDTHHIKEQHLSDCNNLIGHIHKNNSANLVPICKKCHNDVHKKSIIISGYIKTTSGYQLDFVYS